MADEVEERVGRDVRRTILDWTLAIVSIALLGVWQSFGFYTLQPGQAAVILQFGQYNRTQDDPGWHLHLPPPIESRDILNVSEVSREEFHSESAAGFGESQMQTSDNAIVGLGFVVQYYIKDAFAARYRIASPNEVLRDAAQAAMREVVGQNNIDGVLSERRGAVAREAEAVLQELLDRYDSGLHVDGVELQEVQPPGPVRAAFDDVIAARQDKSRATNEADGYRNEVVPRARAEAIELTESALGYRDAKIAEAEGEANRFLALATEYRKAPGVTRTRLYLEAMEEILPPVEKIIIQPGSNVLPYLPLGRGEKP